MPPARSQGPILILVIMVVLFVVLVGVLVKNYATSWKGEFPGGGRTEPRATGSATAPAAAPELEGGLPHDTGFARRNLDFGGNLSAILEGNGGPLGMDAAVYRVASDVLRIEPARFAERTSRLPRVRDLLENPATFCGAALTFRCVPAEVLEYVNDVPDRVNSWRIYAALQRDTDEFVVLETLAAPPLREWTLYRDVVEVDALYLRAATYKTVKEKIVTAPYFLAKNFRLVVGDERGSPSPSALDLLTSRYGPVVAGGLLVFVALTIWTLRRHARQAEQRERDHFYALLRARTRGAAVKAPSAAAGPQAPAGDRDPP